MASLARPIRVPPCVRPRAIEQQAKLAPGLGVLGSAFDHDVIDEPALETSPPAPNVDFDAVFLDVGARRQEQRAARHRADLPSLAALVEALPIRGLASLDPGLAEHAVLEAALGLVRGRRLAKPGNVLPREPSHRRVERRDMKADGAGILRLGGRTPLAGREHRGLMVFLDPAIAGGTYIMSGLRPALVPPQALEPQPLHLPAVRARHEIPALV